MTNAYAAKVDGALNLATVGPHERSAKVNALLVLFNIMPKDGWTDEFIEARWAEAMERLAREKPQHTVEIVPVLVTEP